MRKSINIIFTRKEKEMKKILCVGLVLGLLLGVAGYSMANTLDWSEDKLMVVSVDYKNSVWSIGVFFYTPEPPSKEQAEKTLRQIMVISMGFIGEKDILGTVSWIDRADMEHTLITPLTVKEGEIVPMW